MYYFLSSSDPSLSLPNVMALFENPDLFNWNAIRSWLDIPRSRYGSMLLQIYHDVIDNRKAMQICLNLYLTEHPSPSWKHIAFMLYREHHLEVLEVVQKKYLKGK